MKRVANPTVPWMPKKDIEERAEALIKQYSQEIKPWITMESTMKVLTTSCILNWFMN
jgi:hypothetical protein